MVVACAAAAVVFLVSHVPSRLLEQPRGARGAPPAAPPQGVGVGVGVWVWVCGCEQRECAVILLYVCMHTRTAYVSSYYYVCPHTTVCIRVGCGALLA